MTWASIAVHGRYIRKLAKPPRKRCRSCPKGQRQRVTHQLLSNGVVMAEGCEFHVYQLRGRRR